MGPFGVIPKPFRMESNFEWRVITKRNQLRNESSGKESHLKVIQNGCKTNECAFGGMGPWDPLGLLRIRSHSEWKASSNGGLLRKETNSEMKAVVKKVIRKWFKMVAKLTNAPLG